MAKETTVCSWKMLVTLSMYKQRQTTRDDDIIPTYRHHIDIMSAEYNTQQLVRILHEEIKLNQTNNSSVLVWCLGSDTYRQQKRQIQ